MLLSKMAAKTLKHWNGSCYGTNLIYKCQSVKYIGKAHTIQRGGNKHTMLVVNDECGRIMHPYYFIRKLNLNGK